MINADAMASILHPVLWWSGCVLAALGLLYSSIALFALLRRRRAVVRHVDAALPVTLLKPLCGLEPGLYECLRSFCLQRYPSIQLVFGVAEAADPAASVVRQLQHEFPELDIELVVNPLRHGSNPKVSNLLNMMNQARYDWLVLADSDIMVSPDYLGRVVGHLSDTRVGIVTCAYTARPSTGFWSRLSMEFIHGWFTPSVFVSDFLGSRAFAFGATIAVRRQVLDAIGGFQVIANYMADDYRLGEAIRGLGLDTVLSDVVVETTVSESSFNTLAQHHLRWLRTIRGVRPVGYALAGVTFSLPLAVMASVLTGFDCRVITVATVILAVRTLVSLILSRSTLPGGLLKIPLVISSDLLAFCFWGMGFMSHRVRWRRNSFDINRDGLAYPISLAPKNQDDVAQGARTIHSGETI